MVALDDPRPAQPGVEGVESVEGVEGVEGVGGVGGVEIDNPRSCPIPCPIRCSKIRNPKSEIREFLPSVSGCTNHLKQQLDTVMKRSATPQELVRPRQNGILNVRHQHWNHNTPLLYEDIIKNNEGHVTHLGPIVVRTGLHTGRAANDKFIVEEPETKDESGGATSTNPSPSRHSRICSAGCRPISRTATCASRTATPGPIPDTGFRSASSPTMHGTLFSPATCSSRHEPKSWRIMSPSSR